jgi:hypothetical protein
MNLLEFTFWLLKGDSPGPTVVCSASSGAVIEDSEGVKREVFSFYEVIFRGYHVAAAGADTTVDSGVLFVSDKALFPIFLTDLPCLSLDQRAFLETPSSMMSLLLLSPRWKSPAPGWVVL